MTHILGLSIMSYVCMGWMVSAHMMASVVVVAEKCEYNEEAVLFIEMNVCEVPTCLQK